jgi:hypothetical protein
MKDVKKILLALIPVLIFIGCDKVSNPNQNPNAITNCTVAPHVVKSNLAKMNFRKVVVEDYTGHTCGNCPRAAENATTIASIYGDSAIILAVHAGNQFAPPSLPDFPEDFRTPAGTDWDNFFGMSAAGLPKGCVNRSQLPFPQPRTTWSVTAGALLNDPQEAKMLLTTTLDTAQMLMNVEVKSTFLTALNYSVSLCVVLTQDSIVASQKDYFPPAGVLVINSDERPDYVFDHMLRGAVNGSWGEVVKSAPILANDTVTTTYKCFKVEPFAEGTTSPVKLLKHMSVVAFLFNTATKVIIQAEKVHIK